jgi:hypothetical protein
LTSLNRRMALLLLALAAAWAAATSITKSIV